MADLMQEIININAYYDPNVECTCEGLFADTHRSYCRRRQKSIPNYGGANHFKNQETK